ncbi:transposase [Mycobacterium tuberculosis]|nr:transposase [Mycobacterium tuberculosis]AIH38254.1 transposase [Mycobacterium tuberculosis]
MRIRLTAGQAGDNPQLLPLLDDYRHASTEYALGSTDFRLLADKAYSHPSTRAALRSKKIKHTIPERQDQIDRRKAKGSAGGRPPAFDAALYGLRNTVERGFHRLKQWRGIATRYDKYALTYLGGVLLACAVIHARVGTRNWETRPSRDRRACIQGEIPPGKPSP